MLIALRYVPRAAALIVFLLVSTCAFSGEGSTTFESFYRQGFGISWWFAGIAAVLVGILIFVGLPFVAPWMVPVIGTIGSSIGGLFGLSGIAATNAGLALLGGGAIATGGFGVIGGTALLAAALTFGTEVTIDYAVGSLASTYETKKFSEASLKMMTLPLPVNFSGPDSVKSAGKALDSTVIQDSWECARQFPTDVNTFQSCIAGKQRPQHQLVRDALLAMNSNRGSTSVVDIEREAAMYALLHFLNNDYVSAKPAALRAYELGVKNGSPTLPAFIYSASLLYDESPNLPNSWAIFKYAISGEPKNPLTPVLFSAYLDRLSYRLNDRAVGVGQLDLISQFVETLDDDIRKLVIQQTILSHDLMQIKVAQQRILSLTGSHSRSIRENPKTLDAVKTSLNDYNLLLKIGKRLSDRQFALLNVLSRDGSWMEKIKDGNNPFKSSGDMFASLGWPDSLQKYKGALEAYERNKKVLEDRIIALEREQFEARMEKPSAPPVEHQPDVSPQNGSWSLLNWIIGIFK
jgi:hypothetical protein